MSKEYAPYRRMKADGICANLGHLARTRSSSCRPADGMIRIAIFGALLRS
jgi:hypothetical protein